MLKASELRNLSEGELHTKLKECRKELFNIRFQHATGQLEKTHRLSELRKDIARILTVLREKELEKKNE